VCAAALCGQHRFNWQNYCFDHPAAPFCPGHEYAIKQPPAKDARSVVTNPFPATPQHLTPALIVVGGIDWRFADPSADALVGFNVKGLSASPLAGNLISQLGASQGVTEADMQKIFDRLSGVEQIILSIRDNQIVAMVTATDLAPPAPEAGWKAVPISGNAMLIGHAGAVDQAVQRIAMKGPPAELTHLAEERQANSEFWAVGSAALVGPQAGPQAVSDQVKQFSLSLWIRNRLTADAAFEFNGAPSANILQMWQTTLGATTLEGNVIHVRASMNADEAQQKFGQIAASPLGGRLAALVTAARYLPVRDISVPRKDKPVIYGLDGGPKEVNQLPKR
jgi:hypothetical protein